MNNNLVGGVVSGALTRSEFGESDTDNYFENNRGRVHARFVNLRVNTQDADGSVLVFDNTTYGIWGSYYWGSQFSTPVVRRREQFMWMDHVDNFATTNYKDLGYTQLSNFYSLDTNDGIGSALVINKLGSFYGTTVGFTRNNGNVDTGTEEYGSGPLGTSFIANGATSINIPHQSYLSLYDSNGFTISAWIKKDSSTTATRTIYSKHTGGSTKGYRLVVTNNKLRLDIGSSGANYTYSSTANISIGSWVHVATVYNGSLGSVYHYINGSLDSSQAAVRTPFTDDNRNADIVSHFAGEYWLGSVENIRIWRDRNLSASDIVEDMNSKYPVYGEGLIASYIFDNNLIDTNNLTAGPTSNFPVGFNFNGSNQYIEIGSLGFSSTTSQTYFAWVRLNQSFGSDGPIFGGRLSDTNMFYVKRIGDLRVALRQDDSELQGSAINTGSWYFLAATYNYDSSVNGSSSWTVYVNGSVTGSRIGYDVYSPSVNFIGYESRFGSVFNGQLAGVGVSDRAWSRFEIETLYNNGSGLKYSQIPTPTTTALWDGTGSVVFSIGSDTTVTDFAGGDYEPTIIADTGSITLL